MVDMSCPDKMKRRVIVVELKRNMPLKARVRYIQFKNAAKAVAAVAQKTGIIHPQTPFEKLLGDSHLILSYLGVQVIGETTAETKSPTNGEKTFLGGMSAHAEVRATA